MALWMVVAGYSIDSASRLAAMPVGAMAAMRRPSFNASD